MKSIPVEFNIGDRVRVKGIPNQQGCVLSITFQPVEKLNGETENEARYMVALFGSHSPFVYGGDQLELTEGITQMLVPARKYRVRLKYRSYVEFVIIAQNKEEAVTDARNRLSGDQMRDNAEEYGNPDIELIEEEE